MSRNIFFPLTHYISYFAFLLRFFRNLSPLHANSGRWKSSESICVNHICEEDNENEISQEKTYVYVYKWVKHLASNFSSHFCWRQTYLANVLCGPLEEIQGRFATVTWSRIYFNLKCPLFWKYISLNFFQKKKFSSRARQYEMFLEVS